ncbi:hypothetical protein A4G18_09700 [Pasteurellaceae bacterium Pebbles2]|nr:hypothetical protein [Pasteurellaceae bacterium Pebbles2]
MHPVISKTFGGLSSSYYIRQFLFGLMLYAFYIFLAVTHLKSGEILAIIFFTINLFLYPYSRFVYESIVEYIMGNNVFYVSSLFMLSTKFFTMAFCYFFAILIAPLGLIYLYFYHSKQEKLALAEMEQQQATDNNSN